MLIKKPRLEKKKAILLTNKNENINKNSPTKPTVPGKPTFAKVAKNKNTRQLVELAIDILNKPLRQHLTTWQAKYRRWYEDEIKKHLDKSPQDIQKTFPEYDELTKDLLKVNKELIKYADSIKRIALQK